MVRLGSHMGGCYVRLVPLRVRRVLTVPSGLGRRDRRIPRRLAGRRHRRADGGRRSGRCRRRRLQRPDDAGARRDVGGPDLAGELRELPELVCWAGGGTWSGGVPARRPVRGGVRQRWRRRGDPVHRGLREPRRRESLPHVHEHLRRAALGQRDGDMPGGSMCDDVKQRVSPYNALGASVSPTENDTTGDGSKEHPFGSIGARDGHDRSRVCLRDLHGGAARRVGDDARWDLGLRRAREDLGLRGRGGGLFEPVGQRGEQRMLRAARNCRPL